MSSLRTRMAMTSKSSALPAITRKAAWLLRRFSKLPKKKIWLGLILPFYTARTPNPVLLRRPYVDWTSNTASSVVSLSTNARRSKTYSVICVLQWIRTMRRPLSASSTCLSAVLVTRPSRKLWWRRRKIMYLFGTWFRISPNSRRLAGVPESRLSLIWSSPSNWWWRSNKKMRTKWRITWRKLRVCCANYTKTRR